jgi:hypothetical protein
MVVGYNKIAEEAANTGKNIEDIVKINRLLFSVVVGASAGGLAAFFLITDITSVTRETILGLVTAGYSGSDFIEGVLSRAVPAADQAATTQPKPTPTQTALG